MTTRPCDGGGLTARAERCGLTPKVVPTTTELISGGARIEGVRDPRISDLLGRRQIKTDVRAIAGHFTGKRILAPGPAVRSAPSCAVSCISSPRAS